MNTMRSSGTFLFFFSEFPSISWSSPVFQRIFSDFPLKTRSKSSDDNQTIRGQRLHWRDGIGPFFMGNFSIKAEIPMKHGGFANHVTDYWRVDVVL